MKGENLVKNCMLIPSTHQTLTEPAAYDSQRDIFLPCLFTR